MSTTAPTEADYFAKGSYITQARTAFLNAIGDTEADWVGEERLLDLYSLLVLVKGEACEVWDIHDAWGVARQRTKPEHPDLVRFDRLSPETQAYDRSVPGCSACCCPLAEPGDHHMSERPDQEPLTDSTTVQFQITELLPMLRACAQGAVRWSPTSDSGSSWVVDGQRLRASDPAVAALDELSRRSLTHECDSQEITPSGLELLQGWTADAPADAGGAR